LEEIIKDIVPVVVKDDRQLLKLAIRGME